MQAFSTVKACLFFEEARTNPAFLPVSIFAFHINQSKFHGQALSKQQLSRWIADTVKIAYDLDNLPPPEKMQVVIQADAEASPGGGSPAPAEPQTPMDADKEAIYRHPLFPLLALLFEKCEQSTQGSECITSASFDVDIENFVRIQEKEGKAFFSEDPDLDNLMQVVIQADAEASPGGGSPAPAEPQTPMDADKEAIYRHPLFPLLALLFEKCEQSTQGSECITSASFDVDIENFVRIQEKEGKAFFSEDPDLDNLMVKAIQVLRIHLLELEKVNDLCKDFCSRYIACLKTKMNSETLLSGDPGSPYSPVQSQVSPNTAKFDHQKVLVHGQAGPGSDSVSSRKVAQEDQVHVTGTAPGGTVYHPVTVVTPQGQVVTQALSPGTVRIQNTQLQLQLNQDLSILHHEDMSSKNKRGVLPKQATNVMRSWLFQHIGLKDNFSARFDNFSIPRHVIVVVDDPFSINPDGDFSSHAKQVFPVSTKQLCN
ncbi:UNVERIFIED_CONTAM: hypothetical protein FKN15_040254 [Acipenser sinensis]